ncbi:hypothetical protein KUCAC02_026146, partial [Chaenocephalus aceratus]
RCLEGLGGKKPQRSAGRVVGVYPKGSEERQARRTWKPPSSSLPCPLHALSQAEQRRAFIAEKPQRRRTLIRSPFLSPHPCLSLS